MQRHSEARHLARAREGERRAHAISAPPAKLKKVRKKELAAKAIDSPKTIWINRRIPPEVSPKARAKPEPMMMMTAMILATGPWMLSRILVKGCSQGMFEPAARASSGQSRSVMANAESLAKAACGRDKARSINFCLLGSRSGCRGNRVR